jgi:hypothetical protein
MAQSYKIPSYQSIFDVMLSIKIPLDNIVEILSQSDLDFDSELTGEEVIYESTQISSPKGGQVAIPTVPTTSTYITNSSQNFYDVCLMTVGDLNKIVTLLSDNDFNSINQYPDGVVSVNYNNSDITDSGLKLAFRKAKINITTGIVSEPSQSGYLLQENYFAILQENGFKIQLT